MNSVNDAHLKAVNEEVLALSEHHPVVFFDGVCGLCSGVVDWLLKNDLELDRFRFTPLQGETAQRTLTTLDIQNLNSIVVLYQRRLWRKSNAALLLLRLTSASWRWTALLFGLVPVQFRDLVYDVVAKNRYLWFGKKDSCRVPTPNERARFLP